MTSTEILLPMYYHPSIISTRCGEVYCSQDLENFLINCTSCMEEFNLTNCNLFIDHVRECLPIDRALITPELMPEIDRIPDNIVTGNQYVESPHGRQHSVTDLKVEIIDEKNTMLIDQKDKSYLSDYLDMDDIPIDKVEQRRIIEGIIDEYKRHPDLWNVNHSNIHSSLLRKQYYQIKKNINSKFRSNMTINDLRRHIFRLRKEYQRELERKREFDTEHAGDDVKFTPALWFFNKLSFIQGASPEIEIEPGYCGELDRDGYPVLITTEDDSTDSDSVSQTIRERKLNHPPNNILNSQRIITELISQYKKYALLWDRTMPLYSNINARKEAIRNIRMYINNMFNKNATDSEIKRQIEYLRTGYRRAQRKKHNENYRVILWYYDLLSFIDKKSDASEENLPSDSEEPPIDIKIGHVMSMVENDKPEDDPLIELEEDETASNWSLNDVASENIAEEQHPLSEDKLELEKEITRALIGEYKRYPCLWDPVHYKANRRSNRHKAINSITNTLQGKFKINFTNLDIRNKIVRLRSCYRRVLRRKELFEKNYANTKQKFHPQLWYFDEMSFIGAKESDFLMRRRKSNKKVNDQSEEKRNSDDDCNSDKDYANSETDDNESEDEPAKKADNKPITNNKELITTLIDEYKKIPTLWCSKYYNNDNLKRRKAYVALAKIINEKFDTNLTPKCISREIIKLRSTYKRISARMRKDPDFQPRVWYFNLMSFIESKPEDLQNIVLTDNLDAFAASDDSNEPMNSSELPQNETGNEEDGFRRKSRMQSKENVMKIIELYKSFPILWDKNHFQYALRTERKRAVQKIVAILAEQHNCNLTIEEYRYQIRFLKDAYFRAVRYEASANDVDSSVKQVIRPFFFDQMSFLEPLANKMPLTAPNLKINADIVPSETFSFLVENKPLMIDFIELYKSHGCLWDLKHKDNGNSTACEEAYTNIMDMFAQHKVELTREQVISAINFLHSTVVSTQKAFENYNTDNTQVTPIWFYEHLKFLGRIPRIKTKHCTHCNQNFRTLSAYEKHKIEIAGDYPYKCSVCDAGFVSRSKYGYHLITHKEPHKCELCDFTAFDKHNFNVHMRRHKGIHAHKCHLCEKGFVTSTELHRHMRMHTGEKPFVCHICGKSMPANSEFRQHMKRHRNQRDHKCETCGSAFYTQKTLRDHMASHSTDRVHVCEVCGAAFKRRKTLLQHKALHMGKKHTCKICGKQFAQKAGVYSHMKSHGLPTAS